MTTGTVTQPTTRTILSGTPHEGGFLLTLDGNQQVFASDRDVITSAIDAKKHGRQVVVELEARAGGLPPVVIELKLSPKQEVLDTPAQTHAPATQQLARQAAPAATIAHRPSLPTGLINDPSQLSEQLSALSQHYHVMSPAIAVANMAPGYGANLAVVKIDSTVTFDTYGNGMGPDCYFSKSMHKDTNKRSLNKQGVVKIGQATGVQWDPRLCRRTDDATVKHFWAWTYVGYVRTHDGQVMTITGSRELDLRDGAAEALGMSSPAQLTKARAMGNELCETKAMLRALRVIGIRPSYTVEELLKPFLIVRFSFTPDMADPEIKKLVTERSMAGIGALYMPPLAAVDAPPVTTAPALPASAETKNPFDEPATDDSKPADGRPIGAVKVVDVATQNGTNRKTGKPWLRFTIAFDSSESGNTFSASIAETATKAKAANAWVKFTYDDNEQYPDNIKTLEILDGAQPDLPMGGKF